MTVKTIVLSVENFRLLNRYGALSTHRSDYSCDYSNMIVHDVTENDAVAADRRVAEALADMRLDLDSHFVDLSHTSRIALHSAVVWLEQVPSIFDLWQVTPKENA